MRTQLRGTIIKTPDTAPGLLVADGQQKTFTLEGIWRSQVAPAVNMAVDIELDDAGFITRLTAVDLQQVAREHLEQARKDAADKARHGVGALAARMGKITLTAIVILWIAWFFMPGLSFSVSFLGAGQVRSFTLWDALALDPSNNMSPTNHGFLSLVVITGIAAPFGAAFIRRWYARFLYAAPLSCLAIAWLGVVHTIDKGLAATGLPPGLVGLKMSPGYGAFIIALASLVVAARVLKRPANDAGHVAMPTSGRDASSGNGFCTNCGARLSAGANFCTGCATPRASAAGA